MEIKTKRLHLRPWQAQDLEALCRMADNPKVSHFLRDAFPTPYTREDGIAWLRACYAEKIPYNFAIVLDEQLIGGIGIHPFIDVYRKNAEVGYWLGEEYWGQGLASEAVQAVVDWGFEFFSLNKVVAGIFEGNEASMRVLEKAGFSLEAVLKKHILKHGILLDEYLWVRFR